MANFGNSTDLFQNLVNFSRPDSTPLQLLQVFNSGKPCGWLGQSQRGFWFHYNSNNPLQPWVSLLMPPSQNFYQQAELFPVFAQYGDSLDELRQRNGTQLGAHSFANPDSPVVQQPPHIPPLLIPGHGALVVNSKGTQIRRPFADTLIHPETTWPFVQKLQTIKKQADPNNRLQALRWSLQAQLINGYVTYPRPDMDTYQQNLRGFESVASVLNLKPQQLKMLTDNTARFKQVMHEVARTYCKNFAAEIDLFNLLLPFFRQGTVQAYLLYHQQTNGKPLVLGLEYLTTRVQDN